MPKPWLTEIDESIAQFRQTVSAKVAQRTGAHTPQAFSGVEHEAHTAARKLADTGASRRCTTGPCATPMSTRPSCSQAPHGQWCGGERDPSRDQPQAQEPGQVLAGRERRGDPPPPQLPQGWSLGSSGESHPRPRDPVERSRSPLSYLVSHEAHSNGTRPEVLHRLGADAGWCVEPGG